MTTVGLPHRFSVPAAARELGVSTGDRDARDRGRQPRLLRLGPKRKIIRSASTTWTSIWHAANKDAFRIGDYFLGKRRNSDQWCACWHDTRTRQTVRRSLGTDDFRAAQIDLAAFVTRHGEIRNAEPGRMTVAQLLERHHARHVKAGAPEADFARHCPPAAGAFRRRRDRRPDPGRAWTASPPPCAPPAAAAATLTDPRLACGRR